jgi:hypothetical protein
MPDCQFQLFATDRTLPVIGYYIISRRQLRMKAHCHYPLSLEIQPPGFFPDTMRKYLKSRGVGLSPQACPPGPTAGAGWVGPEGTYGWASPPDRPEMAAATPYFSHRFYSGMGMM